jgi:hypothetical protein
MRTLLVKFAGLTLYIHELQSSTLVLTHERPNKDPRVHKVYEEDFEDTADELEAEALEKLEPGVEASVEGLSLRLIKNDGVLNIVYEGKDGEIVDWKFQGLTGMMASVSTQTVSETQPKLSTSTIHAMAIDPAPQRMTWPLRSKLSSISSIETRPIKTLTKDEEEVPARAAVGAGENEHEHKKTKHTLRSPPHELARTTHESRPWPNHLFMACYRLRPISESDVGILHIDLVEGTVWYEAWHGRAHVSQQTYMRKQVDLRNVSSKFMSSIFPNSITHAKKYVCQRLTSTTSKRRVRPPQWLLRTGLLYPSTQAFKSEHEGRQSCLLLCRLLSTWISGVGLKYVQESRSYSVLQHISLG